MMQVDSFNFGFDSGSSAHFRSEWFQRFIYFNKIQHFVHMEGDCQCPSELVDIIHLIALIFKLQMDSFNFGVWFGF